jgi:TolB-like protein
VIAFAVVTFSNKSELTEQAMISRGVVPGAIISIAFKWKAV